MAIADTEIKTGGGAVWTVKNRKMCRKISAANSYPFLPAGLFRRMNDGF